MIGKGKVKLQKAEELRIAQKAMETTDYALEIKDVKKEYERFRLNVDELMIKRGMITGLVGRNGAGKTTLLDIISNHLERDSGTILYNGLKLWEHELYVKNSMCYVYDQFEPTKVMAYKYARAMEALYDNFDMSIFDAQMKKFEIDDGITFEESSAGIKKIIQVILMVAAKPKILLLDEPTTFLDPVNRNHILDLIMDYMQDENNTVVFSTHITSDLDKIADYVALIQDGRIVFNREKEGLLSEYTMKLGKAPTVEDICVAVDENR